MGFALRELWVMGYHVFMGYRFKIPAYRVGGLKKSWGIRGYGLYPLWVMRGSTVLTMALLCLHPNNEPNMNVKSKRRRFPVR
jgi:hypothetical protein